MKEEQQKVLKSLERAFKKCKEAEISFYGMDGDLFAISKDKVNIKFNEHGDCIPHDNVHDSLSNNGIIVNTYNSYRDSGGF